MKMFNLIDIGEHAGSGVPNIFNVWEDQGWEEPDIKEDFDPDRTSLTLKFIKKQAIKTSDKKQAIKTRNNEKKIRLYLQENETAKTRDIAELLGLSTVRTREILSVMDDVEAMGRNRTRIYRLRKENAGWEEPDIKESFDSDSTSLTLKFIKKQAIKTSDKKQAIKTSDKKQAIKTRNNEDKIRLYLQENETAKTRDIAELLGLSMVRTREILSVMDDVEAIGKNKTRVYRLRKRT